VGGPDTIAVFAIRPERADLGGYGQGDMGGGSPPCRKGSPPREITAHPQFAPPLCAVLKHSTGPVTVSLTASGKMPLSWPLTVTDTVFAAWS
jgi:hypothetical protein